MNTVGVKDSSTSRFCGTQLRQWRWHIPLTGIRPLYQEQELEAVLAVLHGKVAAAEIARQHDLHETLVHKWKRQFLDAGRQSFEDQRAVNAKEVRLEKALERLKRLLREKVVELDAVKKEGFKCVGNCRSTYVR